jgi:hypothetical protein
MQLTEEQQRLINYRESDSFSYSHEVVQPFGVLDSMIDWCKSQLTGDWRWQLIEISTDQRPGRYVFYFDTERDCVAFLLQWS